MSASVSFDHIVVRNEYVEIKGEIIDPRLNESDNVGLGSNKGSKRVQVRGKTSAVGIEYNI